MDPPAAADPHLQPPPQQPQLQPFPSHYPYYSYYQQQPLPYDPSQHYLPQPYAPDPYSYPSDHYYPPAAPHPAPPPPGVEPAATLCQIEPESPFLGQPGINPAAAAAIKALSELSQFAERMDTEERVRVEWHERSRGMVAAYGTHAPGAQLYPAARAHTPTILEVRGRKQRGRGQQGGGVHRGGGSSGRGGSYPNANGQDGKATFRSRGRGGRGGRGRGQHPGPDQKPIPVQSFAAKPAQPQRPIFHAWCDICRVDCNSLEILEQHKSGKRHKKTVQKLEEMQARQKLLAELETKGNQEKLNEKSMQQNVAVGPENAPVQPDNLIVQQVHAENAEGSTGDDGTTEAKLVENNVEKSGGGNKDPSSEVQPGQLATRPIRGGYGRSRPYRGGLLRIGRGGKRSGSFDSTSNKQPKRAKEMPHFCNVCNVTCDTQAVLEQHLGGKKHLSKVKRFTGHVAVSVTPNQVTDPQNQLILSHDPQPNDGSEPMAPESTNSDIHVFTEQAITGMDLQIDNAVKETVRDASDCRPLSHADDGKTVANVPTTATDSLPVNNNKT